MEPTILTIQNEGNTVFEIAHDGTVHFFDGNEMQTVTNEKELAIAFGAALKQLHDMNAALEEKLKGEVTE